MKLHPERIAETAPKTAKSMFGSLCAVVVMSIFLFSACKEKDKTLTVSNVSISGELGNYIKVVDGDYILKQIKDVKDIIFGNENLEIAVKFELVNKYDGDLNIISSRFFDTTYIIPIDNKGMEVEFDGRRSSFGIKDYEAFCKLLQSKVGDTAVISFKWPGADKDRLKKIMTETVNFNVVTPDNVVNEE